MCCNALGVDYQFIAMDLSTGEHRKPEFLQINPAGMVPCIDDNGFWMAESNAIMRYLCRKNNARLYPQELTQQARVDQWCDFISIHIGRAMGLVLYNKIFAARFNRPVDQQAIKDGRENLQRFLPVVDGQLGRTKCVGGDECTIADICLLATLAPCELLDIDVKPFAHLNAWRDHWSKQDFCRKLQEKYGTALEPV